MEKTEGYIRDYRIKIIDGFYEVIQGNRVIYFGNCKKNSTIKEIANKTIDRERKEIDNVTYPRRRFKGVIESRIS